MKIQIILAALALALAACSEEQDVVAQTPDITELAPETVAEETVAEETVAEERTQVGNLVMESIPDIPDALMTRISQYQNTRPASFANWSPDGNGILIGTRFDESTQVHAVANPLGMRRQLTYFDEPISSVISRPNHSQFVIRKDIGGNERFQYYLYDMTAGHTTLLSDPETRNIDAVFSPDGSVLVWSHPINDEGDYGIATVDPDDPSTRRTVHEGEGAWWPTGVTADGSTALIQLYVSISEGALALLNLETGETQPINVNETAIAYDESRLSPDGQFALFTSNEHSEFFDLVRYDIATGEQTVLTGDINWDVEDFELAPSGSRAVIAINAGGLTEIRVIDTNTGETLLAPDLPTGVISGVTWDAQGANVGYTLDAATSPDNAWSFDAETGALTQWTQGEVGGLDTSAFRDAELIEYQSFDGLTIPAYVQRPEGDGPHPVVLYVHGGPESQFRPRFSSNFQFWLADMGIAVVSPNVRGSRGYGSTFVGLDNGMNREDSVRDIGALLDWIAEQPDLDENRVVIYGGSYGGYMVLASLVHYGDRLAGGIDVVGISHFTTFLENTQGYRRNLRRQEYGDERDPAMRAYFEEIAPLNRADEIISPLFIIQGANDPRVPASEAEQMLTAVRANGQDAWFLMAMDEGHGFRKKTNRDFQYQAIALFLEQYLVEAE